MRLIANIIHAALCNYYNRRHDAAEDSLLRMGFRMAANRHSIRVR